MPDISLLNTELAELQRQVLSMDNAIQPDRAQLIQTIQKSHNLLIAMMQVSKHSKVLENFFNLITQATKELYQVAEITADKPLMTRPKAVLQQLAVTYQESMVPMLTRLHNLANDSDDMLKITSIASLGNEVITCSSQIYQYSDKLDVTETMHAILGIVLMFAGIGLIIAILSNSAPGIQIMDAITLIAISYTLCKVAIKNHIKVPEADLTIKSIDNVALALAKIVNDPQDQQTLEAIISSTKIVENVIPAKVEVKESKKSPEKEQHKEPEQKQSEPESEPATGLVGKFKSMFNFK